MSNGSGSGSGSSESTQTSSFDYESEAAGISNYAGSNFADGQGDDRISFDYEGDAYGTTPASEFVDEVSLTSGVGGSDIDSTYNASDAYFTPTQEPTFGEKVTDYITSGGLIGAGIRTVSDIFGGSTRGRSRSSGADLAYNLSISLEEAVRGTEVSLQIPSKERCSGKFSTCSYCSGAGVVRMQQGFFSMQQTCPQCAGSGEEITNPCNSCNGQGKKQASKRLSVTIPKGVDDGTRIRLSGKGEAGSRGASNGDLYLFINVDRHDLFKRSDVNLFFEFPISIADAALGTTIEIPTIDGGKAKIKIPDGTQNGKQFRLKGKGMPFMRRGDYGDLYVQVKTEVPIYLNKQQKELLEKFREIENEKSNPSIKKFFQKAKSFWKN